MQDIKHTKKYGCKKNRGFTLIETLVGITILIFAVTATLTVISSNLAFSGSAEKKIAAFFLAQEAMEVVRNTRDTNSLQGENWLRGLSNCFGSSSCTIDATELTSPASSCGGQCPPLKLNEAGVYQYTSGSDTDFVREVDITADGKEAQVDVTVRWNNRGRDESFTITETIFNWQQ